ncbi:MAG TPA: hypothetical protein VNM90_18010, partial [Haliangium sp.]|nr:hypothetical protein [Haliangium sp.]
GEHDHLMSGLDLWLPPRRRPGEPAGSRGARLTALVGLLVGLLVGSGLPGCSPTQTGGSGTGGWSAAPGTSHASDASDAPGAVALGGATLEDLAATTELALAGELVRRGRYVYSHGDGDGGSVTTMAEDFALVRVEGGHVGKSYMHPINGYAASAVIAFTLDDRMRLRSLVWRCDCDAPLLHLEGSGPQLVVTPVRDGVRQSSETIALEHDWTLTQFQVLSWAMIGSAELQVGGSRRWHLIDIDESGQISLFGTTVVTRHADEPLPEPLAGEPTPRFYTAEPVVAGAAGDLELGPDPPEQIWTDALGCPLLTLDESPGARPGVWRIELVPIPEQEGAALPRNDRDAPAAQSPCPPSTPQSHCILLTLHPRARAADLVSAAAKDGIEVHREGDLLSAHLSDADIVRHFGGRVVYHRVAASASNTGSSASQCNAYLEGWKIPARYERYLASIAVGHQICE